MAPGRYSSDVWRHFNKTTKVSYQVFELKYNMNLVIEANLAKIWYLKQIDNADFNFIYFELKN